MNPAHVESPLHQIQGCSMRVLIRFIRVHQSLNLGSQKTADGCGAFSCQDLGLLHYLRGQAYGQILLSGLGHTPFSHTIDV